MDIFKPRASAALRKPTDNKQLFGLVLNTPRYSELGGLNGPSKYPKMTYPLGISKPADGKKVI